MPEENVGVGLEGEKNGSAAASVEMSPAKEETASALVEVPAPVENRSEQAEAQFDAILSKMVPTTTVVAAAQDDSVVVSDAKDIAATVDEDSKIQKLLDLASVKGVPHAVKVARSLKDYYALDRMHDDMADKLYDGLLAQGLIGKE